MDKDTVLVMIRKCLALGQSPNENEAAAAMAKAQDLLAKYNLSMEDLGTPENEEDKVIRFGYSILGRFNWRRYLVSIVAETNFCKVLLSNHRDILYIVGRPVNAEAVKLIVDFILPQVEKMGHTATVRYRPGVDGNESKMRYRNSWMWGCIQRVGQRLKAPTTDVTSLVLDRMREVDENLTGIKTHKTQKLKSARGLEDGSTAGENVQLV